MWASLRSPSGSRCGPRPSSIGFVTYFVSLNNQSEKLDDNAIKTKIFSGPLSPSPWGQSAVPCVAGTFTSLAQSPRLPPHLLAQSGAPKSMSARNRAGPAVELAGPWPTPGVLSGGRGTPRRPGEDGRTRGDAATSRDAKDASSPRSGRGAPRGSLSEPPKPTGPLPTPWPWTLASGTHGTRFPLFSALRPVDTPGTAHVACVHTSVSLLPSL